MSRPLPQECSRPRSALRDALEAGALEGMRTAAAMAKPDFKLADIRFLPVIPNPHKILCAGVNYKSHAAEVGRELPKQPSMFIRFTDTLVGHGGEMIRPKLSDNFDFEGELTMVIGKGGRHIPIDKALDHALLFNRRLWSIFLSAAEGNDNPQPLEVRQNIANISVFVMKQTVDIQMNPDPAKLKSLIDINCNLAAGLSGRG